MDRWKSRGGKSQRREKNKKEDQRRERVRRKKMRTTVISNDLWLRSTIARRCGAKHISKLKCANHTIVGALLKVGMWQRRPALRREAHVEVKMYNTSAPERFGKSRCRKKTPLWREAHFKVNMWKARHCRSTSGSWGVEKVYVSMSSVKNTPLWDHFWKLRCPKRARCCGAKHISKWTCGKHTFVGALCENHTTFAPLLDLEMSKKCTPLWREAHFEANNVRNAPRWDHFWKLRCSKSARRCCAKLRYTTLHYATLRYATLHYATRHYATLRDTTLCYTLLHTTLHSTTPHLHLQLKLQLHLHTTAIATATTTATVTTLYYTRLLLHYTTSTTSIEQHQKPPWMDLVVGFVWGKPAESSALVALARVPVNRGCARVPLCPRARGSGCARVPVYLCIDLSVSRSFSFSLSLSPSPSPSLSLSLTFSFLSLSLYLYLHLPFYLLIYPFAYASICLCVCLSIYLSTYLLSIYLSVCLSVCLFVCLCVNRLPQRDVIAAWARCPSL